MLGKRLDIMPPYLFIDVESALLPSMEDESNREVEFISAQGLYFTIPTRMRELINEMSAYCRIVWCADWDMDTLREFALNFDASPLIAQSFEDLKYWRPTEAWNGITLSEPGWSCPGKVKMVTTAPGKGLVAAQVDVIKSLASPKIRKN